MKAFSTKNLQSVVEPSSHRMGVGVFEFVDHYSVFHFGRMPDQIPGKGEAIARMTAMNLQLLAEHGIETHLRAFLPPNKMEVNLVRRLDPQADRIIMGERNYFVPLQVVFRNTLPHGSSVFRRLERGTLTLDQLGLRDLPSPGQKLDQPLIEFMTKEEIDRNITEAEAKEISGLGERKMNELKQITLKVDEVITRKANSLGIEHADGKIEFGVSDSGDLMIVDSVGTPDENRFIYKGYHMGKQVLRDLYARRGMEKAVWQLIKSQTPKSSWPAQEPLSRQEVSVISDMYRALCETWTGTRIGGGPTLDEVIQELNSLGIGPSA